MIQEWVGYGKDVIEFFQLETYGEVIKPLDEFDEQLVQELGESAEVLITAIGSEVDSVSLYSVAARKIAAGLLNGNYELFFNQVERSPWYHDFEDRMNFIEYLCDEKTK